jgi:hypothetical protein
VKQGGLVGADFVASSLHEQHMEIKKDIEDQLDDLKKQAKDKISKAEVLT